jgi:hypothetical protein
MTDMIEVVAEAAKIHLPLNVSNEHRYDAAKAAIEAARPYIIAEYNERLTSDSVIKRLMEEWTYFPPDDVDWMLAIKAAIQKAGE